MPLPRTNAGVFPWRKGPYTIASIYSDRSSLHLFPIRSHHLRVMSMIRSGQGSHGAGPSTTMPDHGSSITEFTLRLRELATRDDVRIGRYDDEIHPRRG